MGTFHPRHHRRIMFLLELQTQCHLSERTFLKLRKAAKAWLQHKEFEGQSGAPIEIVHLVHSFLTYAAVISKIVFPRGRKNHKIKKRCSDLQELLEISSSLNLENLEVRNSLEHLDERLDEFLPEPPYSITPFAMGGPEGSENKVVLKRFDPQKFEFWFLDSLMKLDLLFEEIKLIKSRIDPAFAKFSNKDC